MMAILVLNPLSLASTSLRVNVTASVSHGTRDTPTATTCVPTEVRDVGHGASAEPALLARADNWGPAFPVRKPDRRSCMPTTPAGAAIASTARRIASARTQRERRDGRFPPLLVTSWTHEPPNSRNCNAVSCSIQITGTP